MGKKCTRHGRDENAHKILVGKPERKMSFKRSRHRWDNIIVVLWKIGWEGMD
jgi:hypothetical protein